MGARTHGDDGDERFSFFLFFFVLHVLCALRTIQIPARARYAHCLLLGVDTLKRFTVTRLVEKLQRKRNRKAFHQGNSLLFYNQLLFIFVNYLYQIPKKEKISPFTLNNSFTYPKPKHSALHNQRSTAKPHR